MNACIRRRLSSTLDLPREVGYAAVYALYTAWSYKVLLHGAAIAAGNQNGQYNSSRDFCRPPSGYEAATVTARTSMWGRVMAVVGAERIRMADAPFAVLFLAVIVGEILLVSLGIIQGLGAFNISPIWPAAGFAIAVTRVFGYRMAPAIALGETAASLLNHGSFEIAVASGVLAALGALLGAWLLRRWCPRFGRPDARTGEAIRFLVLSVLLVAPFNALAGTGALMVVGELAAANVSATLQTWWLGDMVGIIIFTPVVLAWFDPQQRQNFRTRLGEAMILAIGTLAATGVAFGADPLGPVPEPGVLVLPFLVWGALRFGLLGASSTSFLVALGVTAAASADIGPYAAGDPDAALRLQFLVGLIGATTILLGATANRRDDLQKRAERQAHFVQSIAENLPGAVFRQRLEGTGGLEFSYIAGRFARRLGLRSTNGREVREAQSRESEPHAAIDPVDRQHLITALRRSTHTLEPVELDLRIYDADGTTRWGRSISRPAYDEHGAPIWDGILLDVTEEKAQRAQAEFLSRHDALTGLLNRQGLDKALAPLLARAHRQNQNLGFLLFDLDGFREINDSYGRGAGDALLQALGHRLRREMREEDIKARLGGDEFLLVQVDPEDRAEVEQTGRRLLENLSAMVAYGGELLRPTLSMGVALFPDDGERDETILAAAEAALDAAKGRERGNLVCYSPVLGAARTRGRLELSRDLAHAIDQGAVDVHYQPQIDPAKGSVVGVEALARWQHPERGSISPTEFVPLAERHGLAPALDLVILRRALAELAPRMDVDGCLARLGVNLSGASIRDVRHRRRVIAALREFDIPGDRIELELTETTLAQGMDESAARALEEMCATGIKFAIDDFGTGYGSLTYLRNLPIARIKIDRTFVQHAPLRHRDREIVQALVDLAGNLGLSVVAEGVETRAQVAAVQSHSGIACQGYYFARPMPLAELEQFLNNRTCRRA